MALGIDALLSTWKTLSPLPGGRWLYGRVLGFFVPYTGTIYPEVEDLQPGYARVGMSDRRCVRNHLRSLHALALANLAELASGLCLAASLPKGWRFIPTGIEVDYLKKARGRVLAECRWVPPGEFDEREHVLEVEVRDASDEVVIRARVKNKVGPSRR